MARLTPKRRAFVECYLKTWNASEAARQADYSYPDRQGWQLLQQPAVQEYIQERLTELKLDADEVLARLGEMARASIGDYMTLENKGGKKVWKIDVEKVKAAGHVVKKLKSYPDGRVEIELYDAQSALTTIGKHHNLFTDRTEITGEGGGPITLKIVYDEEDGDSNEGA